MSQPLSLPGLVFMTGALAQEVVGEYFADTWDTFAPRAIEDIGRELEDLTYAPAARRWLEERKRSLQDEIAGRERVAAEQERQGER